MARSTLTSVPLSPVPPWSSDGLWTKAKLFINYAMDAESDRTFDERALWASLSLELLGKAALSRASPLLIAVPSEDGKNLLAAAGLIEDQATFKSISASTVFSRCGRAFKPFNASAASKLSENRNAFLHSAIATFSPIPEKAWWPRFWALAEVLVHACDRELEEFVGQASLPRVTAALSENKRSIDDRVHMLIERARQRLTRYTSGDMSTAELRDWERPTDLTRGLQYSTNTVCPACEAYGTLEGDDVDSAIERYEQTGPDDYDVWLELEVAAEHFSCPDCRFVLDSYELLEAAGLPTSFEAEGQPIDFFEADYGND